MELRNGEYYFCKYKIFAWGFINPRKFNNNTESFIHTKKFYEFTQNEISHLMLHLHQNAWKMLHHLSCLYDFFNKIVERLFW